MPVRGVSGVFLRRGGKGMGREGSEGTYRIASAELLLCADDGSASLGCVERGFASDNRLFRSAAPAGLAADFRDGVPVIHCVCGICLKENSGEYRFRVGGLFVATGGSCLWWVWWVWRKRVEIC